jgi:hypothetical protein
VPPDKRVKHTLREPANLQDAAENSAHDVGSHPHDVGSHPHDVPSHGSQSEAIGRLEQLRRVVPVFAQELVSARRDVSQLRTENAWLQEQLLKSRGHPEEGSQKESQAALHRRDRELGESQGRTESKHPPPRARKRSKSEREH